MTPTAFDPDRILQERMVMIKTGPNELNLGFDHLRNRKSHFMLDGLFEKTAFTLDGMHFKAPNNISLDSKFYDQPNSRSFWTLFGHCDVRPSDSNMAFILRNFIGPDNFDSVFQNWKKDNHAFIAYYNPFFRTGLFIPLIAENDRLLTELLEIPGLPKVLSDRALEYFYSDSTDKPETVTRSIFSPVYWDDFLYRVTSSDNDDTATALNTVWKISDRTNLPFEFIANLRLDELLRSQLLVKCLEKMKETKHVLRGHVINSTDMDILTQLISASKRFTREVLMDFRNHPDLYNEIACYLDTLNSNKDDSRLDLLLKELGFNDSYFRFYGEPGYERSISLVRFEHITGPFVPDTVITYS